MDLLIKLATIILAIIIITWVLRVVLVLAIGIPELLRQAKFKRKLEKLSKAKKEDRKE